MKTNYYRLGGKYIVFILCVINIQFGWSQTTSFTSSDLKNITIGNPTSLQFGPDDKLYVIQQDGLIKIFTIVRNGANNYSATNTEQIDLVRKIPNHNDDGTNFTGTYSKRQSTGMYVTQEGGSPVIYASSSDFRIGAGEMGDVGLCTNSGIVSKLYKESGVWKKVDLVRGLPRSEENHAPNGLQLYEQNGKKVLLIAIGGSTNGGSPSKLWTYISDYALTAAILAIDLQTIDAMPISYDTRISDAKQQAYKYDVQTLDDPTRPNLPDGSDSGDPFGGNDGLNQGKLVPGGPVQIFAGGFRNAYDILISKYPGREGRVYTIDNGPNGNWGGWAVGNGTTSISNQYDPTEPGSLQVGNYDQFEYIGDFDTYTYGSYFGGHTVPIRTNPAGAGLYSDDGTYRGWRNDNSDPNLPLPIDWPPVPISMKFGDECTFENPGTSADKALIYWETSTNGFCEYLYSYNEYYGDLFAAAYDDGGNIVRINMDVNNNVINSRSTDPKKPNRLDADPPIFSGFGNKPLDIIAQADGEIFEGTIWVATWGANKITIFEPENLTNCTGADNGALDEDNDQFNNADEIDNHTDPCSASSKPSDVDGDFISDLNDPDDDNDGITDEKDNFAIDADNGLTTYIPTHYNLFNYDPGTGFFGVGFTGLMCNNTDNYLNQFDPGNMISGGAAGAVTVEAVPEGDAFESLNNQKYAFQFGVNVKQNGGIFTIKSAILPIFFNQQTPVDYQSQGIYMGNGDQDNYIKIVLSANGGIGGIQVLKEDNAITSSNTVLLPGTDIPNQTIIFYLTVDPINKLVYPKFSINGNMSSAGSPIPLTGKLLDAITKPNSAMAVGIISTARESNLPYSATWDYIEVFPDNITATTKGISNNDNINIFPNPGRDKIYININSALTQNYQVKLVNNLGMEIKSFSINHENTTTDDYLDVSNLPTGIYHLQFTSDKTNTYSTVKFVKN